MSGEHEPQDLDALWAAARSRRMAPSDGLMARVLADAMAAQPSAVVPVPVTVPVLVPVRARRRSGWLARLADVFGGFGGLAGVGGAALAGVVLGFVQPAPVTEFADAVLGVEVASVDLMPDAGSLLGGE